MHHSATPSSSKVDTAVLGSCVTAGQCKLLRLTCYLLPPPPAHPPLGLALALALALAPTSALGPGPYSSPCERFVPDR
jgi:hypothetical protein